MKLRTTFSAESSTFESITTDAPLIPHGALINLEGYNYGNAVLVTLHVTRDGKITQAVLVK